MNATITEIGGLPFSIVGVAASYQPGQTMNAQVVGYTLQPGQFFKWYLRMPPGREVPSASATGAAFSRVVTPALGGFELGVKVLAADSSVVAESAWVSINVAHQGVRPVLARVDAVGNPVLPGENSIQFTVGGRSLAAGESVQYAAFLSFLGGALSQEYASLDSTAVATLFQTVQQDNAGLLLNRTAAASTPVDVGVVAQIVRDGVVITQSEPVWVTLQQREVLIEGLQAIYRQGGMLQATASIHPVRSGDMFTYTWEITKNAVTTVWGQAQQTLPTLTKTNLTLAEHDGGRLSLKLYNHGVLVETVTGDARPTVRVTADLTGQIVLLTALAAHYHQGDSVNLSLVVDPAPLPVDQIIWEWKWPGSSTWQIMPGMNGMGQAITAEQALDGVQVRATLDFAEAGAASVVSEVRTIWVDDHGSSPRQQPTVAGAASLTAGSLATLTRQLPVNGPTILTTQRWERKAAGESSFSTLAGQTGLAVSFIASLADQGAQYRLSILKPDGTVAYGPSPAITLNVANPQAAWRQTHFGSANNTGDAADAADPDFDGMPNILEYAFGLQPRQGANGTLRFVGGLLEEAGPPVVAGESVGGEPVMQAQFMRRKNAAALGLGYTVEFSADLTFWEVSTAEPAVLAEGTDMEVAGVQFPATVNGAPARFFRVVVHGGL